MEVKSGEMSLEKKKAIEMYFGGMSFEDIGKVVGKGANTIKRWMNEEESKHILREKYDKFADEVGNQQFKRALEVRAEILEHGKEANRLAAANAIIKERRDIAEKDNTITVVFGNVAQIGMPVSAEDDS